MDRNYVTPEVEVMEIVECYPFAYDGSGEDSNVTTESIFDDPYELYL